ncbi:retinol-binding protein pinta-like [Schistocerca nitens]|uniref:retinol-binding protein pinta-like n=1 Tax=Schistocerca nitens TaxID=7011 RepID=UPI00211768FE|nr:retinol-binding protein pinta-like [Schistocerca nitens]XP_049812964.1 retinol-binding protein pinta-like [Schistocerca nitens]
MGTNYNFQPATPKEIAFIRKQLGLTEEDTEFAVKKLREWLEMQPHLPNNIDDARIERMYINCKCSMERAKIGLDAYFSLKHQMPDLSMKRDPLGPDVVQTKSNIKMMVMPRLTKEGYRIIINTQLDPDPSSYVFPTHAKMVLMELEIMMGEDYSLGDVYVIDLANATMGHLLRTDINCLRNSELLSRTAYCRRIKGVHFVNSPKTIDAVVKLVKSATSKKLHTRIHTHLPGSTTLFEHVAREYIPEELGGTAGPLEKFSYQLFSKAYDMRDWFLEQDNYISDETKRPPDSKLAQDVYGAAGSFKKLSVD